MLGLLQGIGWKLTCARYAIEDAVTQVKFKNYIEKRQNLKESETKGELIYVDDEEEDQIIEICCPECGETRTTTPNTGITCKGCGVRIVIGEDGEIRRVIS